MLTRRDMFGATSLAAGLAVMPSLAWVSAAAGAQAMETRVIPATGEKIPVVGTSTSTGFAVPRGSPAYETVRERLKAFIAGGGTVIDTAPGLSNAEDILGALLAEQTLRSKCWLASRLSGITGRDEGLAQFNATLRRLQTDRIELLQVHNQGDTEAQLKLARDLKSDGKVRYVGVTHYLDSGHEAFAALAAKLKPDFLQVNYSVVARGAEARVLPTARDLGIAVMINRAGNDGLLFRRVKDKPLPDWAAGAGITSWTQAFLRFALSNPAVTVVVPATGPNQLAESLATGALDEAQRASLIDAAG